MKKAREIDFATHFVFFYVGSETTNSNKDNGSSSNNNEKGGSEMSSNSLATFYEKGEHAIEGINFAHDIRYHMR